MIRRAVDTLDLEALAAAVTEKIAVKYSVVAGLLQEAIAFLSGHVSKVTVRYIPFCFMRGFEKHVCGLSQNLYDCDEWVDSVKRLVTDPEPEKRRRYYERLNRCWKEHRCELERTLGSDEVRSLKTLGGREFTDFGPGLAIAAHKVEKFEQRLHYVKSSVCRRCSRQPICDGLERSYADVHGTGELIEVPGEPIEDPMYFRREYANSWR